MLAVAILSLSLLMTACGGYSSSYKAVGFVHSNTSDSAFMSFYQFEGTMVFKLKVKNADKMKLVYNAKLEEGDMKVYYDFNGTKTEWFSLKSSDESASSEGVEVSGTVYIIVETNGECLNGNLDFKLE